ncbi:dihydrofolate reductase [Chromatium weissei]|nr:dihydrofolate reductase [Chromatium weissei]
MTVIATPRLILVAAVASNGVIGRNNALPWRLPADLAHFKRLTLDKTIVMGRRTWESLPGLLPRRRHLVLSRDAQFRAAGGIVVNSVAAALAATVDEAELMIIGGAAVYAETLPLANCLQLTHVHAEIDGDAHFPAWNQAEWQEVSRVAHLADAQNAFAMTFSEWQRRI